MIGRRSPLAAFLIGLFSAGVARADLDSFVKKADPAYKWEAVGSEESKSGKASYLSLTSQTWRGQPWVHRLNIYEPKSLKYPDAMLLIISGGNNDEPPNVAEDARQGFAAAAACGARVAVLRHVPNQPLLDGKHEDELLAESLLRAIKTGDDSWPLLFPMTKAAVRAMDAVQDWAKKERKPASKFVVTGASKRGWTTFLTAAVDPRVVAIAPIVFPNLNLKAQNAHALESWGKPSEEISAYTNRGLTSEQAQADAALARVRAWIDPYTYRDRYSMPILQINGTNDAYWTLDSLNLYWDDLKGPKAVLYVPNAGHNLAPHPEWAVNAVGALFRHVMAGKELPMLAARYSETEDAITVKLPLGPKTAVSWKDATVWVATAPTLDFRQAKWDREPRHIGADEVSFRPRKVEGKHLAVFGDLIGEIDGLEFHLSTPIRIFGPKGAK